MRAVNLIPAEQRKRTRGLSTGTPFLGLVGGLVLVLVAVALVVSEHNQVSSRRTQLAAIQARTAQWTDAAGTYSHDITTATQRQTTISTVEGLIGQRANWSLLLGQLAAAMPGHSQLASLTANAVVATTPSASTGTSTTPAASTSTTATTAGGTSGSSIQLSACAASQSVVAQSLIDLRHISGVSSVTLGSSSNSSTAGGNCGYPVSYSVTLAFNPPTLATGGSASAATAATGGASSTSGSTGVSQ